MKILLIDDDEDTAFLMGVLFSKSNIVDKYFIESNGQDSLNLLQDNPDIDCIFVDLKMPDMSGFEFVEKFEKLFMNRLPKIQLYVLSASALPSDQNRAMAYDSVKEFILKPLTKKKLTDIKTNTQKIISVMASQGKDQQKKIGENEKIDVELSSPVCYANANEIRKEWLD